MGSVTLEYVKLTNDQLLVHWKAINQMRDRIQEALLRAYIANRKGKASNDGRS